MTIEEYISKSPKQAQVPARAIYKLIKDIAPEAVESISYGVPTFKLNSKPLVYFAAYEHHIGLYATPNGHEAFKDQFAKYKQGKGSVQFPLDQPMPVELIKKVVEYRIHQHYSKA